MGCRYTESSLRKACLVRTRVRDKGNSKKRNRQLEEVANSLGYIIDI